MSIFRRTRDARPGADAAEAPEPAVDEVVDPEADDAGSDAEVADVRANGPWDAAEVPARDDRLDLGALRVRGVEGMELRLEIDADTQLVSAATALLGESQLQVQVFAAPRSGGLWTDIRREIAMSVERQGGTVEELATDLGPALRTRMPSESGGRTVFAPATFVGVDGPRWFLRGVLSGRAAIDDAAAETLLGVFRDVVVVRGGDPMPPRELLPLTLPQEGPAPVAEPDDAPATLDPFERGPEITEVR